MFRWMSWVIQNIILSNVKTTNVHIAKTEEERQKIYAYRDEIFCREMNRKIINVADGLFFDEYDSHDNALHFYYMQEDKIMGAVRMILFFKNVPKDMFETYDLSLFSSFDVKYAEAQYIVTDRREKDKLIVPALFKAFMEYITDKKIKLDVIFLSCKPGLYEYYKKLGGMNYTLKTVGYGDGVSIALCNILAVKERYKDNRSPFYLIYKKYIKTVLDETDIAKGRGIISKIQASEKSYMQDKAVISSALDEFVDSHPDIIFYSKSHLKKILTKIVTGLVHIKQGNVITLSSIEDYDIYLVANGEVSVIYNDKKIATLYQGDIFGELAYFTSNKQRVATIETQEDSVLLIIRRGAFTRIIKNTNRDGKEIALFLCQVLVKKLVTTNKN